MNQDILVKPCSKIVKQVFMNQEICPKIVTLKFDNDESYEDVPKVKEDIAVQLLQKAIEDAKKTKALEINSEIIEKTVSDNIGVECVVEKPLPEAHIISSLKNILVLPYDSSAVITDDINVCEDEDQEIKFLQNQIVELEKRIINLEKINSCPWITIYVCICCLSLFSVL